MRSAWRPPAVSHRLSAIGCQLSASRGCAILCPRRTTVVDRSPSCSGSWGPLAACRLSASRGRESTDLGGRRSSIDRHRAPGRWVGLAASRCRVSAVGHRPSVSPGARLRCLRGTPLVDRSPSCSGLARSARGVGLAAVGCRCSRVATFTVLGDALVGRAALPTGRGEACLARGASRYTPNAATGAASQSSMWVGRT